MGAYKPHNINYLVYRILELVAPNTERENNLQPKKRIEDGTVRIITTYNIYPNVLWWLQEELRTWKIH